LFYCVKKLKLNPVWALLIYCLVVYLARYQLLVLSILTIVPIWAYNGKPGFRKFKYLFYLFYPMHLLILAWLAK
jgi:hypothetical protein